MDDPSHDKVRNGTTLFPALEVDTGNVADACYQRHRHQEFIRTARRYRTVEIQAGPHTITAAQPLPDDLRNALDALNRRLDGH